MSEDKKIIRKSSWKFRNYLARRSELTGFSDDGDTTNNINYINNEQYKKRIAKNHEERMYKIE